MIFADLALGTVVHVDANTFTYYFEPHPLYGAACRQLLERIERQELAGYTATHVLGEVAHRLMTMEAMAALRWPHAGTANRSSPESCTDRLWENTMFQLPLAQPSQELIEILLPAYRLCPPTQAKCQGHVRWEP